jgi:hypothetical protein
LSLLNVPEPRLPVHLHVSGKHDCLFASQR